jgi:integrase
MRRGELLGLHWKDINFEERRIILERHIKNNERRIIPMNETLFAALKSLFFVNPDSEMVFPDINGDMVGMAFRRACKRAGIEDFRFHDLRHTFASHLIMGGANPRTVQTLLGHKDLRMTMRYSHLSPEHLRDAVSTLEKRLNSIPNGHPVVTEKEKGLPRSANPPIYLVVPTGIEPVFSA